jgi:hypothetical protein
MKAQNCTRFHPNSSGLGNNYVFWFHQGKFSKSTYSGFKTQSDYLFTYLKLARIPKNIHEADICLVSSKITGSPAMLFKEILSRPLNCGKSKAKRTGTFCSKNQNKNNNKQQLIMFKQNNNGALYTCKTQVIRTCKLQAKLVFIEPTPFTNPAPLNGAIYTCRTQVIRTCKLQAKLFFIEPTPLTNPAPLNGALYTCRTQVISACKLQARFSFIEQAPFTNPAPLKRARKFKLHGMQSKSNSSSKNDR